MEKEDKEVNFKEVSKVNKSPDKLSFGLIVGIITVIFAIIIVRIKPTSIHGSV